ncbi:MAG TPA: response regulator, partial [Pirellulales bacterium]
LTALRRPDDAERCRQLGVAAYLSKPIKPSELLDAMMAAMGPLVETEEPAPAAVAENTAPERSLRVLLAEDSPVNQRVATAMLQKWGHQIIVANNGRQAIAMFTKQPFELVLMDVQMPEMDGLEATRAIRQHEQTIGGHVPIVALTAHAMKGDRQRCLDSGMDAYVTKPIRSKELRRVISEVTTELPADAPSDATLAEASPATEAAAASPTLAEGNGSPVEDFSGLTAEVGHVDWRQALETLDGNRQLLNELIEIFREECPKLRGEIEVSIATGDLPTLRRAAHTLKGALAHLAAGRARAVAERMEDRAREQNLRAASEIWPRLQAELDELRPLLDEFAKQLC